MSNQIPLNDCVGPDYGANLVSSHISRNELNQVHTSLINSKRSSKDFNPVIGILTQPLSEANRYNPQYNQYVLEVNREFVEMSGSSAVLIRYDISKKELIDLLSKINGVLFTGGGLCLINSKTKEYHQYYLTAKIIYNYSLDQKDRLNINFPILGICQGYQLLTMLAAGDICTLQNIKQFNTNRVTTWVLENPKSNSRLFSRFDQNTLDKFQTEKLAFHYHCYGIPLADFKSNSKLSSFFKILQTDTVVEQDNLISVVGIEAHNYTIYGVLYHPEYQLLENGMPFANNRNKITLEIARQFSEFLRQEAYYNPNKFTCKISLEKLNLTNKPTMPYHLCNGQYILAHKISSTDHDDNGEVNDCEQINATPKPSKLNLLIQITKPVIDYLFNYPFNS